MLCPGFFDAEPAAGALVGARGAPLLGGPLALGGPLGGPRGGPRGGALAPITRLCDFVRPCSPVDAILMSRSCPDVVTLESIAA